jgi:hypothetical protein
MMIKELPELLYDVEIDATNWPMVVLTTPEKVDDENLAGFLKDFFEFIKYKAEPYGMIMNASRTSGMTPKQRKVLNGSINDEAVKKYVACVALVFKSKVLSRVLTAILWYKKSGHPVKVFSSLEDAKAWVKTQV